MSDLHEDRGMSAAGDVRPIPDPTWRTTSELNAAIGNLEARLLVRLDAMDQATTLRIDELHKIPDMTTRQIQHLADFIEQRFATVDEKFVGIDLRFKERDIRVETGARAGKEALDAALLAAKELVGTTNEANTIAALKAEQATAKQIDAIGVQIQTKAEATDQRIEELKERLDRFEGSLSGVQQLRGNQRGDTGQYIAIIAVVVSFLAAAIAIGLTIAIH